MDFMELEYDMTLTKIEKTTSKKSKSFTHTFPPNFAVDHTDNDGFSCWDSFITHTYTTHGLEK